MRSAWIKWARAAEHQRALARSMREFGALDSYEYVRWDNGGDGSDPLLRVHWRLKIKEPYPERWPVLIGDILTNLRAALDHTFWAAAVLHSGQPRRPQRVMFPIAADASAFARMSRELRPHVAAAFWELVEAVQPFHGGDLAHTAPLEVLRWLSNVDKHRAVHVVGRTQFDVGDVLVRSDSPLEVVEEWRHAGNVEDNAVVVRLKLRRPAAGTPVDLTPTFAHTATIQVSDDPIEHRTLGSAMDVTRDEVLKILRCATRVLGAPFPEPGALELGEEHDSVAAEYAGDVFTFQKHDGTTHRIQLPMNSVDKQGV